MNVRTAAKTDVGRVRPQNEDNYLVAFPLVAVADGMGGHEAGEVASQLALDVLRAWRDGDPADPSSGLVQAVVDANLAVWRKGHAEQAFRGMGTTLTAAWIEQDVASIAHVGDSRAYLLRGGELNRLTEDQTLVEEMVREGEITADQAFRHPKRNILNQAVGVAEDVEVDVTSVELQPGDRLLLATDGLHGIVPDDRIRQILAGEPDAETACRALVDAANEAGGDDNITVVIVDAEGEAASGAGPAPIMVSKPSSRRSPAERRSRRRRAAAIAVVGLVALAAAAVVISSGEGEPTYVLATKGDKVAILKGTPGGGDGEQAKGTPVKVYDDLPVASLAAPFQREVRRGIVVQSVADGERRIQLLLRLGAPESPLPTISPSLPSPLP